ncbi:MAG: type II secretion system protein [Candidatus Shapirobacteria bacterium]
MKRGFTLIEVLISIAIVAFISGGVLVNLNQYNSRQKLNKSIDDVVSSFKLVQSYAKTRQLPVDSAETELKYIQVQIVDGKYLVADANGVGSTYFHTLVNTDEVTVSSIPAVIYFWPGSGKLVKDIGGTAYGSGETVTITIQANSDISDHGVLEINSLGQINVISISE